LPASSSASQRVYRPDIDGIRAIAILSVVLYHAGAARITGGFTGVDIFFVISGYLIGGHIVSELRSNTFSFLSFYKRRAKRILPAFYAVMLFTLATALLLLSPWETRAFGQYAFAATLSSSNVFFWAYSNYFSPDASFHPLLMTWSLGVEEQFYFVVPVLMLLLMRLRRNLLLPAILALCALSFVLASVELHSYPSNVFFLFPERAWELGLGVALAIAELTHKPLTLSKPLIDLTSLAGLLLMLAPMLLLNAASAFPGAAALPSVLGTVMLLAVPASWINRRLLSLSPLVFLGRISYSLYLWHWPLLAYARIASGSSKLPPSTAAIIIGLSLIAAVLSYYFIEQPFRHSTRPSRPLLFRYAIASSLLLLPCTYLWLSGGIPQRFPQLAAVDHEAHLAATDPCLARHAKINLVPPCYNAADPRPSIALWGDSHSSALEPGLASITNAQDYQLLRLAHAACLPLIGAANYRHTFPLRARQCLDFNRQILTLLQTDPHVHIVILAGRWTDMFSTEAQADGFLTNTRIPFTPAIASALFEQSLSTTIRALQSCGKQVIVLDDVPAFSFDPLMRFRTTHIPARHFLATLIAPQPDPGTAPPSAPSTAALATAELQTTLAAFPNVPLIDLTPQLCPTPNSCAYRDNDTLLYSDPQHLTPAGATYALRDFHLQKLMNPGLTAAKLIPFRLR